MTATNSQLLSLPYPADFVPGARSAVTTCLRIQPAEKVTLITDVQTKAIAASIAVQLEEIGCTWNAFVLEDLALRPLVDMPAEVLADMETSEVSIFAVQVQTNELRSRMQMTDVVNRRHMRHAHMVNITPEVMCSGMRADFNRVDRLSQQVLDRVRKAHRIRATTAAGTNIVSEMNPGYKWFKTSGIISTEKWGNLPGGECFTSPGEVNGTFVVDGVVGDWLCARYGLLAGTPLTPLERIERPQLAGQQQEQRHHAQRQRRIGSGEGNIIRHPHIRIDHIADEIRARAAHQHRRHEIPQSEGKREDRPRHHAGQRHRQDHSAERRHPARAQIGGGFQQARRNPLKRGGHRQDHERQPEIGEHDPHRPIGIADAQHPAARCLASAQFSTPSCARISRQA